MKLISVIMAGGSGKRFWPLSRENKAKQSLALFSEKTLLEETILRVNDLSDEIFVISSLKQKEAINKDVQKYEKVTAIYEPSARNTAPCVALATKIVYEKHGENAIVLVLPADHFIKYPKKFVQSVKTAFAFLEKNKNSIGTIGLEPSRAETGYGYIKKSKEIEKNIFGVETFVEKPNKEKAEEFFNSKNYFWNGGIFIFNTKTMIENFQSLASEIWQGVEKIDEYNNISKELYDKIPSISIDYAIMEKTNNPIFSIKGDFGWNDIGTWLSYYELLEKDEFGNVVKGKAHLIDCKNCFVVNRTKNPLVLLDKTGELLVQTDDVLLSANLEDPQAIRKVSNYLKERNINLI